MDDEATESTGETGRSWLPRPAAVRETLRACRRLPGRARRRVVDDLATDPYLPSILLVATVLFGFWFWHLLPNFATRDEERRLIDPMTALGKFLVDPGWHSLQEGVAWGAQPFGATFYLFGLALLPVVVIAVLQGRLDIFTAFKNPDPTFGYWALWHETPRWVWTIAVSLVRLFDVAFAVGCVYLTYRLGVQLRDRSTGRLAAMLLTVTFGVVTLAHEGGEDLPALFFVLLALSLLLVYVRTGEAAPFLAASAAGGVAIAFKLTAVPVVVVVGAAYLLRAHRSGPDWRAALSRPWLLVAGATLGLLAIVLGFPTLLVGRADLVVERVFTTSFQRTAKPTGPTAPIWWWFLRQYFQAFGLPLFLGTLGGLAATVARFRGGLRDRHGIALVLVALGTYVLMFSRWHDLRVHHLLPTFPLLVLLLAVALVDLSVRSPRGADLAPLLAALLLLTGGAYAVVGDLGYATAPRDQAVAWFDGHAAPNATVEVYRVDVQDTAIPHWMNVSVAYEGDPAAMDRCPTYIELGYRDLLFLKSGTYYRNGQAHADYVRALLNGEYNYRVVAEFGPRPPNYVPQRPRPGSLVDLFRIGIVPATDQYADEQELAPNQFTVILQRTGPCDGSRTPPTTWW